MENSLSIQQACHHWAFEPYLTHAVIAFSRHDRSGTFAEHLLPAQNWELAGQRFGSRLDVL